MLLISSSTAIYSTATLVADSEQGILFKSVNGVTAGNPPLFYGNLGESNMRSALFFVSAALHLIECVSVDAFQKHLP